MKTLVGSFNQEKALVGAFSVNVKTLPMVRCDTGQMGHVTSL